uniref:SCY1-like protein 2 n=1 Tax=Ditylenchus dipsaci TaxID=166011 RepID=A0A915EP36_9BILA
MLNHHHKRSDAGGGAATRKVSTSRAPSLFALVSAVLFQQKLARRLHVDGKQQENHKASPIRVQTLVCLGKLMANLEPWMVSNQILPALPKINSKEPGILMACLGIYKIANETDKFGISTEQCAKSVLPFLMSSCVENTLNLQQFEQFMALLHLLMKKVETEQRKRLQQLSASQEESRNMNNFNFGAAGEGTLNFATSLTKNKTAAPIDPDLKDLAGLFGPAATMVDMNPSQKQGSLTLEDKKRLAAEQDSSLAGIKSKASTESEAITTSTSSANQPMKDMWASSPFSPPIVQSSAMVATGAASTSSSNFEFPMVNHKKNDSFAATADLFSQPSNKANSAPKSTFDFAHFPQPPTAASNPVQRAVNKQSSGMDLDSLFGGSPALIQKPPSSTNPVQAKNMGNSKGGLDLSQFDKLISFPTTQKNEAAPAGNTNGLKDPFDGLLN